LKDFYKKHKKAILIALGALVLVGFIQLGTASSAPPSTSVSITSSNNLKEQAEAVNGLDAGLEAAAKAINSYSSQSPTSTTPDVTSKISVEVVTVERIISILNSGKVDYAFINPNTFLLTVAYSGNPKATIYSARFMDSQSESITSAFMDKNEPILVSYKRTSYDYSLYGSSRGTISNMAAPVGGGINFLTLMFILLGVFLLIRFFVSNMRKAGNVNSPVNSEAKEGVPSVTFADVAGCDEAIEDMQELVDFLKYPERFAKVKANPPKGALLVGPPGTGKTLLARAVAGEAHVPFYNVAGSDFVEMYVGVGARRVRDLFKKAKSHPEGAIVFIDEIDAVGRARGNGINGGNSETENTLNSLLVELDGFEKSKVIVIAATNRDDILDKALMRPGRLDRKIHVPLPDRAGRERILAVHSADKPFAKNVDFNLVARRTPGMSGADLAQLTNEAAMNAARENREVITNEDFDNAIATITMGKARKSAIISEEDKILTAWHEAGHALCGLLQQDAVHPVSISIVPRGFAGGVTHFPGRDSGYMTRKQAYAQLVTAMGGMAAEQMFIGDGEFTTGPSSDLQQGSNLAIAMITQFGMGESLLVKSDSILSVSNQASDDALGEADALLRRALQDAKDILNSHSKLVHNFVDALIENETLVNEDIKELMAGQKIRPVVVPPPAPRGLRVEQQESKQTVKKGKLRKVMDTRTIPHLIGALGKAVVRNIKKNKPKKAGM
jgi:cell division protease FtsH